MVPKNAAKRRRLPPTERREEILKKAINLFSEHGFESSTREIARQLGITQPLLYRYFPSKDDLVRAAYRSVYLDRWDVEWDRLLCERDQPLDWRLKTFYRSYTETIFTRDWMRIYLFSGLKGADINRWYIGLLEERILQRIIKEYRYLAGLDGEAKPQAEELELAWALHSGIFYLGVREHIFSLPPPQDRHRIIANVVDVFHQGIQAYFAKLSDREPAKLAAQVS
ncbi:TetR/AcrR family transcriptional regulator (plasmid) [Rhizobium sp. CB3060]|uniref:TetR/AcrR family transcriptional regulator n=1 Tax=Rhizobium sp. CB3060 TaxID=3138255 RepID=UPI0021A8FBE9|nr:TetR/AcrR family transcriptional regulator [Rhizobium tropici]UWU25866.1 TetR/AcrR family transcriptional regulator [Rhizobium tropici]